MNDESDPNIDFPIGKFRKIGCLTDIGKVRETDEDCFLEISFGGAFGTVRLLAVADGMGGHAKGEVASKIALSRIWLDSFSKIAVSELSNGTLFPDILEKAIKKANEDILEHTSKHPETSGMGTTSVCAIVTKNEVHLANVGDSRAYVISANEIRQETKDHSFVQELVDKGEITEGQARDHPDKNVITRGVGISPSLEVDTKIVHLKNDESLLLCCDGVIAHLLDDDIKKIVLETPDPQQACQKIVDMANEKGGSDNISLIILSKPWDLKELGKAELEKMELEKEKLAKEKAELENVISNYKESLAKNQHEIAELQKYIVESDEQVKSLKQTEEMWEQKRKKMEKGLDDMKERIAKREEKEQKANEEPEFFKKRKKT